MTVADSIKFILNQSNMSQRKLAERIGYSSPGSISKPLSRNDGMGMSVETFIKWLDTMDYQIILQPLNDEYEELILDGEPE